MKRKLYKIIGKRKRKVHLRKTTQGQASGRSQEHCLQLPLPCEPPIPVSINYVGVSPTDAQGRFLFVRIFELYLLSGRCAVFHAVRLSLNPSSYPIWTIIYSTADSPRTLANSRKGNVVLAIRRMRDQ